FETLQRIEKEEQRLKKLVEPDNALESSPDAPQHAATGEKKRKSAQPSDAYGIEQTVKHTLKQPDSHWKDEGFDSSKWESDQGNASAQAGLGRESVTPTRIRVDW
ncbi:MAG: hypothetical protein ACK559_10675, partial [bacterium]